MPGKDYSDFDVASLFKALEAKRTAEGLTEQQMMDAINRVNNQLHLVPMSLATVKNMLRRNDTTCQHALHLLRWLGRTPESFLKGRAWDDAPVPFTDKGRFYWSMRLLASAVNAEKSHQGLSWQQVARELGCSQNQVSGLHRRTYGISIHLAMRITQWLGRSSTEFVVDVESHSQS